MLLARQVVLPLLQLSYRSEALVVALPLPVAPLPSPHRALTCLHDLTSDLFSRLPKPLHLQPAAAPLALHPCCSACQVCGAGVPLG